MMAVHGRRLVSRCLDSRRRQVPPGSEPQGCPLPNGLACFRRVLAETARLATKSAATDFAEAFEVIAERAARCEAAVAGRRQAAVARKAAGHGRGQDGLAAPRIFNPLLQQVGQRQIGQG